MSTCSSSVSLLLRSLSVQTDEFLPRFDFRPEPYTPNSLVGFDWTEYTPQQRDIFTKSKEEASLILIGCNSDTLSDYVDFAIKYRAQEQLFWIFEVMLDRPTIDDDWISEAMNMYPPLAFMLLKKFLVDDTEGLPDIVEGLSLQVIRAVILSANELGIASLVALEKLARDIANLDIPQYFDLLWLAALSVRPPNLVQEVLLVLHDSRLELRNTNPVLQYAHKQAIAIIFDRSQEAAESCPCDDSGRPRRSRGSKPTPARLQRPKPRENREENAEAVPVEEVTAREGIPNEVMAHIRVDDPTPIRIHSHIRLKVSSPPEHSTLPAAVLDAVVLRASRGELLIKTQQSLPPEFESVDWRLYDAGSVATSKAMLDAVRRLTMEGWECCSFNDIITGREVLPEELVEGNEAEEPAQDETEVLESLNESQRNAVLSAKEGKMSLIWGPPG